MGQTDWKDLLGAAFGVTQAEAEARIEQEEQTASTTPADARAQQGKQMIDIVLDRKGRAGKQATIVCNLQCDDTALKQLARTLKQQLGVGGSARGGEILIQGDVRHKVLSLLQQQGFKARII